jgi:hypothetical protein
MVVVVSRELGVAAMYMGVGFGCGEREELYVSHCSVRAERRVGFGDAPVSLCRDSL